MLKSVKNIILTFLIGCLVFILGELISGDMFYYEKAYDFLIEFSFYQLYTFVISYANTFYFEYIKKLQFKSNEIIRRIVYGILGATIITLIAIFFLRVFISVLIFGKPFGEFISNEGWKDYSFGLWITLSILSIFYSVYFYNLFQKNKIKEQKVIAGVASAKFDALKNQLDPHFLFNSLNVLTSLIEENPKNAQKFTTALSKVYRYVLEQKSKDLVTVDEELDFARTYMSLLKMRFEDSIIFEIPEKASNPESKVVPLSLQLLLENAVKHNMVTSNKPLHIKIYEDKGNLVVMNNLQPKKIVKKSSGVGLNNIKQRYQLLTKKQVIINQEAKSFAVAIPILSQQINIMRQSLTTSKLDDNYVRARKHVEALKEFYYSLISYCIIIPFLFFIWYNFTPYTIQWFWFPMAGWGIGLVFQAYEVFVNKGRFGKNWERKKIEEFIRQEEQDTRWN